ncbi:MAG: N-acetylmuramoyl-L-alanine amidase [Enterococcus sp.]
MIKKWIGTFLSILLLSGTIAPNAYAVAISSSYTEEQNQVNQIDNTEQSTSETTQEKVQTATEETNSTGKISEESIKTVTIDEEHFPDTNFRNYISETIDTDHNGILSNELIETTELDLSGKQIKSIEGIQYFNYLQKLEVQENELQEIEVASLATLQYLDVSNNHLSTINLSKNKEITYFDGKEQTIDANAIQVKDQWQITQEKLKPEKDRTVLKTEDWKYDGEKFIADKQSPLIYSYQIPFSSEAILESTSENSLEVTVNVQYTEPTKVESIIPLENTVTMYSGETKQLEYTSVPENAEITQPIWETSDNSIVQVSRDGKITGLRAGEAEITLKDGERSLGIFSVQVKEEATSSDKTQSSSETDLSTSKESSSLYARKSVSPTVSYQTHVRTFGWQNEVTNGATAGTIGQNKRLEAIKIKLSESPFTGNVEYSSHVQSIGWQGYVNNGATSGTTDQALRTEAIKIRLTGEISQQYDIYYRVHSAYFGWLGWTKNGENAGSSGFGYQMEAIQIKLVPKGQSGPATSTSYYEKDTLKNPNVNYQTHSQSVGWQNYQMNGATAGTIGKGLRLEAMRMNITNTPLPGTIEYSSHVQSIGWQGYVNNNGLSGTTGSKLRAEAIRIRLTGQLNQFYDVYYRVHSAQLGWLDWARNGQNAGTSNLALQMEAIQVVLVKKGAPAPGAISNPYQTSINHLFVMGHGVLDPGAAYNGINERDFTRKELMPSLQKWASQLKRNRITFYNTNADMYQDSQRLQGAYTVSTSFSSVTEFHLDAGGIGTSTGGHVIAHRNGNSLTTQNYAIANVIRAYVGLWGSVQNTGGISLRSDLLNMNVLNSRGIPYRLAELGFITNINDVANIRRNKDQIAKGIVESVTGEKL